MLKEGVSIKTGKMLYIGAVAAIAAILMQTPAAAAVGEWGLTYVKPGEKPQGNADAAYLKALDAYYVGETDEKVVYLTFDAGYEAGYTAAILDTLKQHDVPAAFFLVGTYIRSNPELIKRMDKEGHIVANHTMKHPDMTKITSIEAFKKELSQVEEVYKTVTGRQIGKYYRPPCGKYNEANIKMAQALGYKTIFWSLAYADWDKNAQPTKAAAFSKLIPRLHPGAVLLLHSTSKTNADILGDLIEEYHRLGYTFKSLEHLAPQS